MEGLSTIMFYLKVRNTYGVFHNYTSIYLEKFLRSQPLLLIAISVSDRETESER